MLKKVNYESHSDSYWVNLRKEEIELIAGLLWLMRLGTNNVYKAAAGDIMVGIDEALGADFTAEANGKVGPYFTLEDVEGNIGVTLKSPYATIEVEGGETTAISAP